MFARVVVIPRGARETGRVRDWVVGSAVIVAPEGVLLVQNRRRNGNFDWSPPGGVIEVHAGESLLDGLAREVREETGLRVTAWGPQLYQVDAVAPDLGWRMRAEIHLAAAYEGELEIDDPDGIVVDAGFVAYDLCEHRLGGGHPWVREPLRDWLAERWEDVRTYGYRVDGTDPGTVVVTRL
jgi:8-oxo-dGTP diphosphatase